MQEALKPYLQVPQQEERGGAGIEKSKAKLAVKEAE